MPISIPVVSSSGAKSTVSLADPVVASGQQSVFVANYPTPAAAAAAAAGKRLVFPAGQTYTVASGGLRILPGCYVEGNNSTLKFGNNTTTSDTLSDSILLVTGSDVTIDNLNFDGNAQNQGTIWSQYRHCVKAHGAYSNVTVKNCDMFNIIGDGVYINLTGTASNFKCGPSNTFSANDNNRNGVSIIAGDTIEVFNCTFTNQSRDDMPAAIDIEPNSTSEHLAHVDLHDNVFIDNGGTSTGTQPAITVLLNSTVVDDIKIRNNDISGTRHIEGIVVVGQPDNGPFNASTRIVVSNNNIHDIGKTGKYGVRVRYYIRCDVINNIINGVQWGIANQSACLGATSGNTFTNVTTPITQTNIHCS